MTIICLSTYPLFIQSMDILMENCPKEINYENFRKHLENGVKIFGKVVELEDLHIWQLNSDKGISLFMKILSIDVLKPEMLISQQSS